MKKLLAIMLALIMVLAMVPALADDPVPQGYCGADASYASQTYNYSVDWKGKPQTFTGTYYSNAVWTITENGTMPSDGTKPAYKLTISGTGAIGDFGPNWTFGRPWHFELINNSIAVTDVRPSITAIEIVDGITEIGAHTFEAYPNVTSIVIPDSVTKIGENAFNSCTGATSITLGSGLREIGKTAFSDCDALTTISFPDKLETIGKSAFSGCNNLSGDLVIPDSVKTIGEAAFANDTNLRGTLTIGSSVASIGNSAFSGCKFTGALSIPDSVTSIGDSAFTNCKFTELSLGNGLTEIGESALNTSGTYSGHLLIPDSVTTIGKTAFNGLKFSSISLGKAVSTIGQSAFANCTSIHSLDITAVSNSVTYGDSAFHSLRTPNTIYVNSDSQKSAISAAITDGRTAFAITNGGTFPVTTQFSADQLAAPVKDGCIFGGWYTDEACTQKFTGTPAANSTYYAKWTEKPIKFDANGGTGTMPNENYTVNQPATDTESPSYSISFPACTFTAPDGQEFAGWKITEPNQLVDNTVYLAGNEKNIGKEFYPSVTVTAQWKDKPQEQQPSGGGNGGGYYHPTTTPVPVIVIPPKTGDMTVWQSILHFLGIR